MSKRYAIYLTLPENHPLHRFASCWLGNDLYDEQHRDLSMDDIELDEMNKKHSLTKRAAVYGFHLTLKAPFRLKQKVKKKHLIQVLKIYCTKIRAFDCQRWELVRLGDFIALVPQDTCKKLNNLAKECVQTFDYFRAKLTDQEIALRNPASLSKKQLKMLEQWGYPFVMDEFYPHFTLTDTLTDQQLEILQPLLQQKFEPYLQQAIKVSQLSLVSQSDRDQPFKIIETINFVDAQ